MKGVHGVVERHGAVHHRAEESLRGERGHRLVLRVPSHRGAEEAPLIPIQAAEVEPGLGAAGGAADHHPAPPRQAPLGALPRGLAHAVDHHGALGALGDPLHLGRDVLSGVVDHGVGAEPGGEGELVGGAAGGDDAGAEVLCDLDGRLRHASAGAPHQHGLAGAEASAGDQHPPRGERRQREGRGLAPRPAAGARGEVGGGHGDDFRDGAVEVFTEDPVLGAEGLVVGTAGGAMPTTGAGVEHHFIPDGGGGDTRPHGGDHPGAVGSDDVRQHRRAPGDAADDEEIEPVERGGPDPDVHPPRRRGRRGGEVGEGEAVEPAGGRQHEGAHRVAPLGVRRSGSRGSR